MTQPSSTPLIDIYKSLVRTRSTYRAPRNNVERGAYAQSVARRLLVANHEAEYRTLYEKVLEEIPAIPSAAALRRAEKAAAEQAAAGGAV